MKYGDFNIHIHTENNVTKLSKTVLLTVMKPVIKLKGIELEVPYVSNVSVPIPVKISVQEGKPLS